MPVKIRLQDDMNTEIFLNALLAYFVMIDPVGVALVFNALTQNKDDLASRKIAFQVVMISFLIIMGFGFFGHSLLAKLGIAMDSFRIAGGLLLFYTAFKMVVSPDEPLKGSEKEQMQDVTVFPLSFPMVAGPGCLTLTILLFSKYRAMDGGVVSVVTAASLMLTVSLVCFLMSKKLINTIGKTANSVMKRLLGVLLASLSIQFIVDGIKGLM